MKYKTKSYVKIAGTVLRPGEIFETADENDKISRLLRLGAVERVMPVPTPVVLSLDNERHPDIPVGSTPDLPQDSEEAEDKENDVDLTETFEEEAEAPEIDVMDGISMEPEEEAEAKPTKGRGRKK